MVAILWILVLALAVSSVVAIFDFDVEIGDVAVGRLVYGALVLLGLGLCYVLVVETGRMPWPGWAILGFAVLYLPFLSSAFVDLTTTDRHAREQLEDLLLSRDYVQLRHASGSDVIKQGRRRLRLHWEVTDEDEGIAVELDVHPSLLPVTVSRPHVAFVRDQLHLDRIRQEILRARTDRGDEVA